MNIPTWQELHQPGSPRSPTDCMLVEIAALRRVLKEPDPRVAELSQYTVTLEKQLANAKKHIKVLQAENIEQWDEITALRNDAKDHEVIVKIYADKIIRLKGQ